VPSSALQRPLDASLASDSQFDRHRHRRRIIINGASMRARDIVNVARAGAHDAAHRASEHQVGASERAHAMPKARSTLSTEADRRPTSSAANVIGDHHRRPKSSIEPLTARRASAHAATYRCPLCNHAVIMSWSRARRQRSRRSPHQRPSFSFSSALTACGFALPPEDFIT
jgi:hypothetical protein